MDSGGKTDEMTIARGYVCALCIHCLLFCVSVQMLTKCQIVPKCQKQSVQASDADIAAGGDETSACSNDPHQKFRSRDGGDDRPLHTSQVDLQVTRHMTPMLPTSNANREHCLEKHAW